MSARTLEQATRKLTAPTTIRVTSADARSGRIDCLRDAAHAAHVPDSDRDGPGSEPVTVSGWYEVPTVSGRRAWQRYDWRDGQCVQGVCTYDLCAEDAYRDADAAMDWDAYEEARS